MLEDAGVLGVVPASGVVASAEELSALESNRSLTGVFHILGSVRILVMLVMPLGRSACVFHSVAALVVAAVGMVGSGRIGG